MQRFSFFLFVIFHVVCSNLFARGIVIVLKKER